MVKKKSNSKIKKKNKNKVSKKKVIKKKPIKKKNTKSKNKKTTKKQTKTPKTKFEEGTIIQLEVKEIVGEDGICKKKGHIFFVKGSSKGDIVNARITKVIDNICFAEPNIPKKQTIPGIPNITENTQDIEIPDLPDL
jgi:predicted RNA-binding protein with TRAM domain